MPARYDLPRGISHDVQGVGVPEPKRMYMPLGPLQEFRDALQELRRRADTPSFQKMAKWTVPLKLGDREVVRVAFSGNKSVYRLPKWALCERLVRELARIAPECDPDSEAARFRDLWFEVPDDGRVAHMLTDDPRHASGPTSHAQAGPERQSGVAKRPKAKLAELGVWPSTPAEQPALVSLILLLFGIGLAIGLGKNLGDELGSPVGLIALLAGLLVGFVLRKRMVPIACFRVSAQTAVGVSLTIVLLVCTWLDSAFVVIEHLGDINSILAGFLVGMALSLTAGTIQRLAGRLSRPRSGMPAAWLGSVSVVVLTLGTVIALAQQAGHGHVTSSIMWATITAFPIGAGMFLGRHAELSKDE